MLKEYRYSKAIDALINEFPMLRSVYTENIDDYEGLPYVFYESVFVKYIVDKIRTCSEMELSAIFNFVENLLKHVTFDEILKDARALDEQQP
jgi:hypothetical protein